MGGKRQRLETLTVEIVGARQRIAELERELEASALRDGLTDLAALTTFERHLDREVERSRRHGRSLVLGVVDVDGFRTLNASHGRDAGDRVLVAIARTLDRFTRATDLVGRAGDDEFLLMLPESAGPEALQCAERILLELEAIEVPPLSCVSVSIGLVEYRRPMTSEQLMAAAGTALDRARGAGGSRSVLIGADEPPVSPQAEAFRDAVAGLAEALLERDRYTGEHSESVVALAAEVARGLGLDEIEIERVRSAALLHDIGKVATPDEILHKKGPLDDREWVVMRQHPVVGERILRAIPGFGSVARIVRHEHERFDGTGYPDGLAGDAIPIGSRIILACDAYHAMTSDRPYRKAMSHAEAIEEIAAGAGRQFDPDVTGMLIGSLYMRPRAQAPGQEGAVSL